MKDYTDGPWMLSRGAQGDAFAVEAETSTVAHIKHHRNSYANGALISASPDLLEAAKHAAMEWRLHGQLTDSCRVLERAIAKAEGRSYEPWHPDDHARVESSATTPRTGSTASNGKGVMRCD